MAEVHVPTAIFHPDRTRPSRPTNSLNSKLRTGRNATGLVLTRRTRSTVSHVPAKGRSVYQTEPVSVLPCGRRVTERSQTSSTTVTVVDEGRTLSYLLE